MANELLSEKINQIDESKIEKIKDLKLEKFSSILEKHKESKKFHTLASQIQHQVTLKQLSLYHQCIQEMIKAFKVL